MTPDGYVTAITEAATDAHALVILADVKSRATLEAIADLVFVDPAGHGSAWLRKAIVAEARS
jgi:hypothetical protein